MIFSKKQYLLFTASLLSLIFLSYFFVDKTIAKYFIANVSTYEGIGDFISIWGESHWYIATAVIGFIIFKYFKKNELFAQRFLFLLYANIFSGLISLVLKHLFGRIRPWGMRNDGDEYGFLLFQNFDMGFVEKMKHHALTLADSPTTYTSFPSGHTTTVFAVFTYLCLLFPKYLTLWLSLAVVLSSSRLLANDHFVSDIFAGIIVGTISTMFIYSKMKEKIEKVY
ncbi:MAG: phospholipid phosphatase [Helicobacteraceae bacterium CG2_30_36_10]|nr:MAG: phospholipid phosphatase [Helicobacteraceae bacterium CG2_30_36_10]